MLLVTGGGKGIGAECALALAESSGARLVLFGRAAPGSDAELDANLARLQAAGLSPLYVAVDVTDDAAVATAVATVEAQLGPVTVVLHAAGRNVPRLLSSLTLEDYRATLAPKVGGLANVLAALDPARLRLLVSFGSIIGRMGLAGEADYALANEWLGEATARFARAHPGCRCLTLDWSVWSGVGMGERLASVDQLARAGISAIPVDSGVEALCRLLSRPAAAGEGALVVAGRFGEPPTLPLSRPELPLWRYLEHPRVFVPGVELVVDCEISADTAPHLADHVFRGEPLFAAVLGLEAMAQAVLALTGRRELPLFENVELSRPVAIPPGQSTRVRLAALVTGADRAEVALRDAATGFATDHFRATCRFGPRSESDGEPFARSFAAGGRLAVETGDLYGTLLFHRGRFERLHGYRHLSATQCLADISPDGSVAWFGRYLPSELVLGDPGARDAAIHGIQACIPHATLLPVAVERITLGLLDQRRPLAMAARERFRNGDTFVYDLELSREDGTVVERWQGLTLRAVDRTAPPASWAAPLLASYAERRLQEILPGAGVRIALGESTGERDSNPVALRLLGVGASLLRRADGKPEPRGPEQVSISHADGMVLAVACPGEVGCDLEPVAARPPEVWRDLLGSERFALAELAAREAGEDLDAAATRVWTVAESLKKAGAGSAAPIVLRSTIADGWILFGSGSSRIGSFLAPLRGLSSGRTALAVAAGGS